MKRLILLFISIMLIIPAIAQLKSSTACNEVVVDILDGTVNSLRPNVNIEEIKKNLPCFTSTEEESSSTKCGGGVFYKDKDMYIYTGRDYVEIGEKFKGKLSIPLIGSKRGTLFKYLGNPKIKETNWEAYQVQYGTLVLHYNSAGKVSKFQFSTKTSDYLSLCQ